MSYNGDAIRGDARYFSGVTKCVNGAELDDIVVYSIPKPRRLLVYMHNPIEIVAILGQAVILVA